jgi:hypothetical protein
MSGGFLERQQKRGHQVVIFTFAGELSSKQIRDWNEAIYRLKELFGAKITGVTLRGEQSPRARSKTRRK